jgi:uncharacterized damage-inducible protein DinB
MSSFHELVNQYLAGPELLRKALAGMTKEQLLARPIEGRWSTMEVVVHIADFEPILADRIKRTLSTERPLLLTADENLFAATLAYHDRDLNEELDLIDITRKSLARVLKHVAPEAAGRVGIHTFKGQITVEGILMAAVNHIPHHIHFIEEKRKALGI